MSESSAAEALTAHGSAARPLEARCPRDGRDVLREGRAAPGRAAGRSTLYLSTLTLAPSHPAAARDLASPYELHRTLARVFGDGDLGTGRYLWRQEGRRILVQSPILGRWETLEAGYCEALKADRARILTDMAGLEARWRFCLSANPTVTRRGRRCGLAHADEALVWLHRQGLCSGFAVEHASMPKIERLEICNARTQACMGFIRASFEGVLAVLDGERFGAALARGLGHGKAFGMGLLVLAPV